MKYTYAELTQLSDCQAKLIEAQNDLIEALRAQIALQTAAPVTQGLSERMLETYRNRDLNRDMTRVMGQPVREAAWYKGLPMHTLNTMKAYLKDKYPTRSWRFRWRGPRRRAAGDRRSNYSKQSDCVKQFATSYAVYERGAR